MTHRFHAPQTRDLPVALAELRAGRKVTHWIWWIFPQLSALGRSARAIEYGLRDLAEARAFLADPVLRPGLLAAAEAMLAHAGTPAAQILGEVDAMKLRSSMTLFEAAAPDLPVFARVLAAFYAGVRDPLTLAEIARLRP